MGRHAKAQGIIEEAHSILSKLHPMTVRQVFYRLVSSQVIKNTRSEYQAVCNALRDARKERLIHWDWIEDRLRRPHAPSMWSGLADFAVTARKAYRRNVWDEQPDYTEVWLEKDALSGIFDDVLESYGVTLNVGRGYDSWDAIRNAAERFRDHYNGGWGKVLYFGDWDPSGEDMVRSLRERLAFFDCNPDVTKCALILEDIEMYALPPDFTKRSDTRRKAFVARYGDVAVELDALPVNVLEDRLRTEVESRMDMDALAYVYRVEQHERDQLVELLERVE